MRPERLHALCAKKLETFLIKQKKDDKVYDIYMIWGFKPSINKPASTWRNRMFQESFSQQVNTAVDISGLHPVTAAPTHTVSWLLQLLVLKLF